MITPPLTRTRADLFRALGVLAEAPGPEHTGLATLLDISPPSRSDWTEAFVVQLVPYASIYLSADGMLGGETADRVAGFWRALRLPVPSDPDHVTALLGLYATVLEAGANEPSGPRQVLWREARAALLHEHLLSWLLVYTAAMTEVGPAAYAGWATLLRETLLVEAAEVGAPCRVSMHLRDVPPLSEAVDRLDALLDELLAPARSGLVVTKAHLGTAAQQSALGLRLGDRRRMLRTLFEQDPLATLAWLTEQAKTWAVRHEVDQHVAGPSAVFWAERAAATAEQLETAGHVLRTAEEAIRAANATAIRRERDR
jgi:TorA maturation chaperone TorD